MASSVTISISNDVKISLWNGRFKCLPALTNFRNRATSTALRSSSPPWTGIPANHGLSDAEIERLLKAGILRKVDTSMDTAGEPEPPKGERIKQAVKWGYDHELLRDKSLTQLNLMIRSEYPDVEPFETKEEAISFLGQVL